MTEGVPRPRIARSRLPWRLRLLTDPAALRHLLAVLVLAGLLATLVGRAIGAADRAQRRWGASRTVWVATTDLAPGAVLDRSAIEAVRWPVALVPSDAVEARPASDAVTALVVPEGLPITDAALRPGTTDHRRTVAIPLDRAGLTADPGDRVDVWAVVDPTATVDGPSGADLVAEGAEVLARDEARMVMAVAADEVEGLARASVGSRLVVVGSP